LPERPKRILIVGGGYIAVEFAGIFHGFGSHVIQMYRGPLFLRGFDEDVRKHLLKEMEKKKIDIRFNANPAKIEKLPSGSLKVTTETGEVVEVDCVMYATGRSPKLEGLGVDKIGLAIGDKGQIVVNELNQTNVPGIFAVGDCIDRIQLTPVALREGHLLADRLFAKGTRVVDYENVASAVFSQPEIGTCGLTEAAAVEKYKNITVYTAEFKPMKYTMLPDAKERYYFKLIVDDASKRVVGLHCVCDNAGEMVQGFAVAMKAGATKEHFDDTIGIHPTSAEEFVTMRTPSYRYVAGVKSTL
jgi:glutathione reductase (NADPH)